MAVTKAPGCWMVILGAEGDLSRRLLAPAIFNLEQAGRLPEGLSVLGVAREGIDSATYRQRIRQRMQERADDQSSALVERFHYLPGDLQSPTTYAAIRARIGEDPAIFYLATPPSLFGIIPERLVSAGLLRETPAAYRRVIFEKPFGRDLVSCRELNRKLTRLMNEGQIYRIDHYLGKETVQNILVARFGNGIFEPLWNRRYIDSVSIEVSETLGADRRAGYYDGAGALRDMVPNHLFQLVSLVGMEPPNSFAANDVRDEKVKLLRAITPFDAIRARRDALRGQYRGYTEEPGVPRSSRTETFVALELEIDNWRWSGVPFYLRTGKKLATRATRITLSFRRAPTELFRCSGAECPGANRLEIDIQPQEKISLVITAKRPGPELVPRAVPLELDYSRAFGHKPQTGYETLLYDAFRGDATLFQRADQVEAAWSIVDPLLEAWSNDPSAPVTYEPGTDGPLTPSPVTTPQENAA